MQLFPPPWQVQFEVSRALRNRKKKCAKGMDRTVVKSCTQFGQVTVPPAHRVSVERQRPGTPLTNECAMKWIQVYLYKLKLSMYISLALVCVCVFVLSMSSFFV